MPASVSSRPVPCYRGPTWQVCTAWYSSVTGQTTPEGLGDRSDSEEHTARWGRARAPTTCGSSSIFHPTIQDRHSLPHSPQILGSLCPSRDLSNSQSLGIPVKSLRSGSSCTKQELGPLVGKWHVRTLKAKFLPSIWLALLRRGFGMDTVQCASSAQVWPHVRQGACAATILVCSGFTHTLTPVQPPRSVLWKVVYPVPTPTLSPWWGGESTLCQLTHSLLWWGWGGLPCAIL